MKHHPECIEDDRDHEGMACVNAGGQYLTNPKPSDERPENFFIDGDGQPGNIETERYLKSTGQGSPVTDELLRRIGERDGKVVPELTPPVKTWTPDHPTIELGYEEPNGFEVKMTVNLPVEMNSYYDSDMALRALAGHMSSFLADVGQARKLEKVDGGEPTGD